MATKELVTKVWIEPGCIVCDACETACPDVFEVKHEDETCIVRPEALEMEFTRPRTDSIFEAADECPVDVIKFETVAVEVAEDAAAATTEAPVDVAKLEPAVPRPAASEPGEKAAAPVAKKPPSYPKAKELDPAIQALLAATTVRGGRAVIERGLETLPEPLKRLAKASPDELPPDARWQRALHSARPGKTEPTRRNWILGTAWAAFGVGAGILPVGAGLRFMMPNVLEQEDPKVPCGLLGKYAMMQPGEVNEDFKQVKPSGFWIIREENRIAALSIICTHLGCIPTWLPNDRKFKCPCHGSGFKPSGVNFEGPAPRPLERFKIYLDGDEVIVDRSRKFLAMGPNATAVWKDPEASIPV
jgi:cytochrome b6-f complex iron-sulfur subunit